jgi:hypothetical protein
MSSDTSDLGYIHCNFTTNYGYDEHAPGETFRVVKEKEVRQFGEYRTRRLMLEAWDALNGL